MSTNQTPTGVFRESSSNKPFNIRPFIRKILYHWPLFFLSFLLILGFTIFYLRYARPIYEVHAKVLVKDSQSESQKAALQELNLSEDDNKNVESEIGLMSSVPVTEQVITDLQLWITYKEPTMYYSYRDLYKNSPIQFKLIKIGKQALVGNHLDIFIEDEKSFLLKSVGTKSKRYSYTDRMLSSFGEWKLDTTSTLKDYIGKTVRITLQDPKDVLKYYQDNISETAIPKSSNIDISINDEVPERGRDILNDLLRVYMDASVQEKRRSSQNTLNFVEQRLVTITKDLTNVESQYEGYKSDRGITAISDQSTQFLGNVQSNEKQINEINIKLAVIEGIERYVNSNQSSDTPPATLGVDDQGLLSLIKQLSDLQLERTKRSATLPESSPLLTPLTQQITSTREALKENLKGIRASLLETKRQLQSLGNNYESSIKSLPGQERQLFDINRMKGIKENLYIYLLQKKEELGLDYASTISDAVIIDQAHNGPQKYPVAKSVYAISFLIAFLIPLGFIYGRDMINYKIVNKDEITSTLGIPILSEIVQSEYTEPIVVLNQASYIGEQFRDLRTKLAYLHGKHNGGKITLFTSTIPGEGKSFVFTNLGVALGVAGRKTILLEMDLRRPTMAKTFGLDRKEAGLTDYLIGNVSKEEIIHKLPFSDNLYAIDCGRIPPNPSELLESQELSDLLSDLRSEYDHILIDSPPVQLLADAKILASKCDVTFLIIRQNFTPKQHLQFIKELYSERKLPKMNLIFNGISDVDFAAKYNHEESGYITKDNPSLRTRFNKFLKRF